MTKFLFVLSSTLVSGGMIFASAGIFYAEMRWFSLGIVLILGAAVFATLYLGSRVTGAGVYEPTNHKSLPPIKFRMARNAERLP